MQVLNHLLFHKSILSEDEGGDRLNDYIRILKERGEGEYVSIEDPFERAIALAFELVLEEHLNPWDLDLVQFATLYARRLKDAPEVDLITAGRLLLMAWRICRMQSDDLRLKSEPPPEPEFEEAGWDDIDDAAWLTEDVDYEYTVNVLKEEQPESILDEKIRHRGNRRVTLLELVQALEEARAEAELRAEISSKRIIEKERRKRIREGRAQGSAHQEDQDADNVEVWKRIRRFNGAPIPLASIHTGTRDDLVKSLVAVLFLARGGKVHVSQEDFPFGTIYVKNVTPADPVEGASDGDGEGEDGTDSDTATDATPSTGDSPDATVPEGDAAPRSPDADGPGVGPDPDSAAAHAKPRAPAPEADVASTQATLGAAQPARAVGPSAAPARKPGKSTATAGKRKRADAPTRTLESWSPE